MVLTKKQRDLIASLPILAFQVVAVSLVLMIVLLMGSIFIGEIQASGDLLPITRPLVSQDGWDQIKDDGEIKVVRHGPMYYVGTNLESDREYRRVYRAMTWSLDPKVRAELDKIRETPAT